MIKKKSTKLDISYELNGKNICFTYENENDKEIIKIGSTKFPYEMILEIVNEIESWKNENKPVVEKRQPAAALIELKPTEIEDLRDKNAPLIQTRASEIQKMVDESMSNFDESEQFSSLSSSTKESSSLPENMSIEDDNPIGISVERLATLGPVPETPPEFKKQLQEIGKERATKKTKNPAKSIKRID